MTSPRDEWFACIDRHDTTGAVRLVQDRIDHGESARVLISALSSAQREVGERWQRNEWTVAQEHQATAAADRALAAVAVTITDPVMYPLVLVACAEGEWHTLAARMVTDLLRAERWDARFLGGSVPSDSLSDSLQIDRPMALAIHCSISMAFPGVARAIEVAHRSDIPVLVGGRAFADSARRAVALGADGWAPDLATADAVLHRWAAGDRTPSTRRRAVRNAEYDRLHASRGSAVELAETHLLTALPALRRASPEHRQRTREDLDYLFAFLEAAVLADDSSVLDEYLVWLEQVLSSRGVPRAVLAPTLTAMGAALRSCGEGTAAEELDAAAERFLAATSTLA